MYLAIHFSKITILIDWHNCTVSQCCTQSDDFGSRRDVIETFDVTQTLKNRRKNDMQWINKPGYLQEQTFDDRVLEK